MQVLLTAINSKYIHSNLAVYSLKAYHDRHSNGTCQVELAEYTINQPVDYYIADIYKRKPEVLACSCYIWNIRFVYEAVAELHKLMPQMQIWLGGPEVTFDGKKILLEHPEITGIMYGEGEKTFSEICNCGFSVNSDTLLNGIVYRQKGQIIAALPIRLINMDELPFVYDNLEKFTNKIIYYESSRGCPFGCSYCLSSVDQTVRFRSLSLVFQELQYFLDHKISQVKFVDRTFNCNHKRTMELLQFLKDHDNGVTNFHFEIAADLLTNEEIELLSSLRSGQVQLEIGVQSTNAATIEHINRIMDFTHLTKVVKRLNMGANVHLHLDLIAGLPEEDINSFHKSFNDVYSLSPEQLQLGFLKVLKGSPIEEKTEEYGILYKELPNYEVLSTKWLSYDDVLHLKQIEEMVEVYYNSRQYVNTMKELAIYFKDAYILFEKLAAHYEKNNLFAVKHSRISRYEILYAFIMDNIETTEITERELLQELLIYDLYLRENLKTRPYFAEKTDLYKNLLHQLYIHCKAPKSAHIECFSSAILAAIDEPESIIVDVDSLLKAYNSLNKISTDMVWVLFDYEERDPLNYNSTVRRIR